MALSYSDGTFFRRIITTISAPFKNWGTEFQHHSKLMMMIEKSKESICNLPTILQLNDHWDSEAVNTLFAEGMIGI